MGFGQLEGFSSVEEMFGKMNDNLGGLCKMLETCRYEGDTSWMGLQPRNLFCGPDFGGVGRMQVRVW